MKTYEARHHSLSSPKQPLRLLLLGIRNGKRRPAYLLDAMIDDMQAETLCDRWEQCCGEWGRVRRVSKQATCITVATANSRPPMQSLCRHCNN